MKKWPMRRKGSDARALGDLAKRAIVAWIHRNLGVRELGGFGAWFLHPLEVHGRLGPRKAMYCEKYNNTMVTQVQMTIPVGDILLSAPYGQHNVWFESQEFL